MNIALVAEDAKKELMVQFCIAYKTILEQHTLLATATTGRLVGEATGMPIQTLTDPSGGFQQIAARVSCNEVDFLLFLRDPSQNVKEEVDDMLKLCDIHAIPYATNLATAEVLIQGLARGDFGWRDIINPKF